MKIAFVAIVSLFLAAVLGAPIEAHAQTDRCQDPGLAKVIVGRMNSQGFIVNQTIVNTNFTGNFRAYNREAAEATVKAHLKRRVEALRSLETPSQFIDVRNNPSSDGPNGQAHLDCHGTIQFADGATEAGVVRSIVAGGSGAVSTVWIPDCYGEMYPPSGRCALNNRTDGPRWEKISHTDDYAVYIDLAHAGPGTNMPDHPVTIVKVSLFDFNTPQNWGQGPVLSVKSRVQLDCNTGELRSLDHTSYNAHMGEGSAVLSAGAGEEWHKSAPGTADDFLWRKACERK